jgi:CheY-like chemotaxis protein
MSKRILVVKDQEDNRQIVRDLLTTCDVRRSRQPLVRHFLAWLSLAATVVSL